MGGGGGGGGGEGDAKGVRFCIDFHKLSHNPCLELSNTDGACYFSKLDLGSGLLASRSVP